MDIIQQFAAIVAKRVVAQLNGRKKSGHKLDMNCRVTGCKQRSRGPRFRYICKFHGAVLNITQQRRALEGYRARNGA